jgi:hypothetical protein
MRVFGAWLGGALALVSACGGDFDPGSRVAGLRVLAVQANAPYAAPGESVHLDALAFDPQGRSLSWGWGSCFDPTWFSAIPCIDAMQPTTFVVSPNMPSFDVTLPADIVSQVPQEGRARASVGIVTVVCPGDLTYLAGAPSIRESGALPFSCRDPVTGRTLATEEYVVGVKRIFARESDRNQNPAITQVTWDGADWPETEVKTAAPCATNGHKFDDCAASLRHVVAAVVSPSSFESGVDSFQTPFHEQLIVEHYATEGIFEHDVRIASDPATGWVARVAASGRIVTLWFVAHDNRGGVAWAERRVQVTP